MTRKIGVLLAVLVMLVLFGTSASASQPPYYGSSMDEPYAVVRGGTYTFHYVARVRSGGQQLGRGGP
jgi:hypothetical protein